MALIIGTGIEIGTGISIESGPAPATLMLSLDAAGYSGSGPWIDTVSGKQFTLYNNPVYSSTIGGGTFEFVTSSFQYAECPTSLQDLNTWTVLAWHYYTGTNTGPSPCIVTEYWPNATSNLNYTLGNTSDTSPYLEAGFFNGAWRSTPTGITLTPNSWYQLVGTYDGSTVRLYVNNSLVASASYTGTAISGQDGIRLMRRWDNDEYWGGYLSIIKIYDGDIGAGGVAADYNTNLSRFVSLVYNLDAANYSAIPANGSTVAGRGNYPVTVANPDSTISWNSANGGVFKMTTTSGATNDYIYGGPNYVTGQSYTVFMVYQLDPTVDGRLLNTQDESSKDWLMGSYSGNMNVFFPNGVVNLNSDPEDAAWHFIWGTFDYPTTTANLYIATNTAPTSAYRTVTDGAFGGFNQLRLFSRSSGFEVQTGNIGLIQVYNGVISLTQIQTLYNQFKTRFGY